MGHWLDILILSSYNQKEKNGEKTGDDSLLITEQSHVGIRCPVQAQYIWRLSRIQKKACVYVLGIVHMFSGASEASASGRHWERPKIILFCTLGSLVLKIKPSQ